VFQARESRPVEFARLDSERVDLPQSLLIHNIFRFATGCEYEHVARRSDSGAGDIQLSMREARCRQHDARHLKRLALRLIDRDAISQSNRELHSFEFEKKVGWDEWYARDEHNFSLARTSENGRLDYVVMRMLNT